MVRTDKKRLEFVAGILENWSPEGSDTELLYAFGILDEIPRSKYKEQWDAVRTAINSNTAINDAWLQESITDLSLSKKGHWWWNPAQW